MRKIRDEHAAKFDYDLARIFADLKQQERESEREYVTLAPKRLAESGR